MTATNPTADDLRTVADNMKAEGHTSRAELIAAAADQLEAMAEKLDRYTKYGQAVFSHWDMRNNMPETYVILSKSIIKRVMEKNPAKAGVKESETK